MLRRLLCAALLLSGSLAFAQDKPKEQPKKLPRIAISDPKDLKDDKDFAVQGEYVGGDGKNKMGAQVIARGAGKFEGKLYGGGLPGAGWDGKNSLTIAGARKDDKLILAGVENGKTVDNFGMIEDGMIKIFNLPELKKVERTSPMLGAKPPEGAVVLFGKEGDEKNWENGKLASLSDGNFLAASNPRSKRAFQSFTAHIEFRLPWMPNSTGQGRGNSGVYVQDRYELQVLDSFGLSGENNECGGFYTLSKPKVNMCLPPMAWQTYDIEYTAAEFKDGKKAKNAKCVVKHNGVLIQDFEFTKHTPGGKFQGEVADAGALFFQDHGDPVVYRNVWVAEKK
jgi:Domain of Unknown Function (DUF1080)